MPREKEGESERERKTREREREKERDGGSVFLYLCCALVRTFAKKLCTSLYFLLVKASVLCYLYQHMLKFSVFEETVPPIIKSDPLVLRGQLPIFI